MDVLPDLALTDHDQRQTDNTRDHAIELLDQRDQRSRAGAAGAGLAAAFTNPENQGARVMERPRDRRPGRNGALFRHAAFLESDEGPPPDKTTLVNVET